ncbi:MAG: hypothetical protein QMD85_00435 [Candidatus Aenigmarchaeota archaeon]|nr:hypothetical protein [Candidatus Aenigmarchaeota archaeon]MDI6721986.1 hypothetical protein [Candidatus Aenigmarchaeota archaeon]
MLKFVYTFSPDLDLKQQTRYVFERFRKMLGGNEKTSVGNRGRVVDDTGNYIHEFVARSRESRYTGYEDDFHPPFPEILIAGYDTRRRGELWVELPEI